MPSDLLSGILASPWDERVDLLVLLGSDRPGAIEQLRQRGQRRIFQLDPASPPAVRGGDLIRTAVPAELEWAITNMPAPLPGRIRLADLDGQGGVPPLREQLEAALAERQRMMDEEERLLPRLVLATVRNVGQLARLPSLAALRGALPGCPAVIIAPGPSLDRNIHQLRDLQGRCLLIAVSQTLRALRQAGVRPDLVLAIDPQNLGYHFAEVSAGEIPVLGVAASVGPELFSATDAALFTFAASPDAERWPYQAVDEEAAIDSGGSVATAAIPLALALGCHPIVLVGRDLALQGRKYYAEGAVDGGVLLDEVVAGQTLSMRNVVSKRQLVAPDQAAAFVESLRLELVPVPGFYGEMTVTSRDLFTERRRLEQMLARMTTAAGRLLFVNATEGGAHIDGIDHQSLATASAGWRPRPESPAVTLKRRLESPPPARSERMLAHVRAMIEALDLLPALVSEDSVTWREMAMQRIGAVAAAVPILSVLVQATVRAVQEKALRGFADGQDESARALIFAVVAAGTELQTAARLALANRPHGGAGS